MNKRKKTGQALVEYALLTMLVVMLGLVLSKYSTVDYRDSVYNFWADVIAQPLPSP